MHRLWQTVCSQEPNAKEEAKTKMKIPLSKPVYEALQKLGEKGGLTVDEEAQVAVLYFLKKYDVKLFNEVKKHADPKVLQVIEKS